MRSRWQTSVSPISTAPPSQAVALYTATVGLKVEYSAFGVNPAIDRSQLIAAIEPPPSWAPTPWPPHLVGGQDDITIFALAKLKALFDFAARLPNGTANEILRATYARFPLAEPTRAGSLLQYKRFRVEARILLNGDPEWSYEIPSSGKFPPGVRAEMRESDLDVFIQNLVRADLQRRIASFGGANE